ncbi:DNA/RNA non-specific endonuclease [Sorangium sp. So ce1389]|uniref:DNA/RNA non-specific endonuclease n=1 Tax=Sorangium sp. So ce1389 TaxID=3133336 RepID=UPI003F602C3C
MSGGLSRWLQLLGLDRNHVFRAKVERLGPRRARTLVIEGTIRNLFESYRGPRGVPERTPFDHRGHLIARRFGGPNRRANLVAMHGLINMSGGPWCKMEEEVAALIGDRPGEMRITVQYVGQEFRPVAFHVAAVDARSVRRFWRINNANPYLYGPGDPRARRQEEQDAEEVAADAAKGDG